MTSFTKTVLAGAAFVAFSGLASASTIGACNVGGYSGTSIVGVQCEVGDKIFDFSAFTAPTTSVGSALVTITGPGSSPYTTAFNVIVSDSLGGVLQSGFTLTYTVAVDLVKAPSNYIQNFATGILDSSTGSSAALITAQLTGDATCNASSTDSNGNSVNSKCNGLNAINLNVNDVFTYSQIGDGLSNVSNTFTEAVTSATPEPTTFVLMGAGLGLLGMLRRKTARR